VSWSPDDLLTDADLVAYEAPILEQFGKVEWAARRRKALEDWLWPQLRVQKFPVERFRTRYAPSAAFGYTSSIYTDRSSVVRDDDPGDVPLQTILATADTDFLYIGLTEAFRGLSVRVLDNVSAVAATLTVQAWADEWLTLAIQDGTSRTAGVPFSGGGAITWEPPEGWVPRKVNDSSSLYWVRVSTSAAPAVGTTAAQIGCIRRSLLCGPAAYRTLMHIFREAPVSQDGPWREKADWYEQESQRALERVIPVLGSEFDVIDVDDVVDEEEQAQTTEAVTGGGWSWERM